jgi:hypothetical protein
MGFLIWLAGLFFILWIIGWVAFHVAGFAIHILLLVAIVLAIVHLASGGRRTAI